MGDREDIITACAMLPHGMRAKVVGQLHGHMLPVLRAPTGSPWIINQLGKGCIMGGGGGWGAGMQHKPAMPHARAPDLVKVVSSS